MALVNERKVIFLGRRESGKTTMIHHLLRGAVKVPGCLDREYPRGISQYTRDYPAENGSTRIHFWDFGSDASFRRLHPIFMTGRTVYVVMINAREGNEQSTASEWLRDIQRYAPGCPVLVVLNSVEQSLNTGVDQTILRKVCPTLKDVPVVCGEDDVEQKILLPLLQMIAESPLRDGSIPEAWELVIRELRSRTEYEISMSEFERLCDDLGIPVGERLELLELCRDLGVCLWQRDGALRNHIILRQEWLTNALNAILEESDDKHGNGVMTCSALRGTLAQSKEGRILECVSYSWDESDLVMNVMRQFGMLYDHLAERVFLPGLCRSGMPTEAAADTTDPRVLEVVVEDMDRTDAVFYGLMTQMAPYIPDGSVWDGGVRFLEETKKRSAVVLLEEKGLRIYIRSRDWRNSVFEYLDQILTNLHSLISAFGLDLGRMETDIVCHIGGCTHVPYEVLCMTENDGDICHRDRSVTITRGDILGSVGALRPLVSETDEKLIRDVVYACEKLQDNPRYHSNRLGEKVLEDDRNRYIRDVMNSPYAPYTVLDQSQRGDTPGGVGPGELDLLVQREDGSTWTVIEALNIKRGISDKSNWNSHLFKLLHHYDKQGQPFAVLLAYVEAEKDDWGDVWDRYRAHMETHSAEGRRHGKQDGERITYRLVSNSCEDFQSEYIQEKHYRKVAQCIYETGGHQTAVIHIFVRLEKTGDNTAGEEENHGREVAGVT